MNEVNPEPDLPLGPEPSANSNPKPKTTRKRKKLAEDTARTEALDQPRIPSAWVKNPIFKVNAVGSIADPIRVAGLPGPGELTRNWTFGVPNPLPAKGEDPKFIRQLSVREGATFFGIVSLIQWFGGRPDDPPQGTADQPEAMYFGKFSFSELARRIADYDGPYIVSQVREALSNLRNAYWDCWGQREIPLTPEQEARIASELEAEAKGETLPPSKHGEKPVATIVTEEYHRVFPLVTCVAIERTIRRESKVSENLAKKIERFQYQNLLRQRRGDPKLRCTDPEILRFFANSESELGTEIASKPTIIRHDERLGGLYIHRDLVALCMEIQQSVTFLLKPLRDMRSDIAKACYMYLPSRALLHTDETDPFLISLRKLFTQIGADCPESLSERRQYMIQHGKRTADTDLDGRMSKSVVAQLDGAALYGKKRFRCKLIPNLSLRQHREAHEAQAQANGGIGRYYAREGDDYLLACWVEQSVAPRPHTWAQRCEDRKGTLLHCWLRSGRTEAEYAAKIKVLPEINFYEEELLERCSINPEANDRFLRIAKALLGEVRFGEVLSEFKDNILTGLRPRRATGLLNFRLCDAVGPMLPQKPKPEGSSAKLQPTAPQPAERPAPFDCAALRHRLIRVLDALPESKRSEAMEYLESERLLRDGDLMTDEISLRTTGARLRDIGVDLE